VSFVRYREKEYIVIPISCPHSEKEALLLKAFHEGKIVIIDELNTMPFSEALLNGLLSGVDLEGKRATKPGFKLIGTQNGIEYAGRQPIPTPLLQRLMKIDFPAYPKEELTLIAQHDNLSEGETKRFLNGETLREIKQSRKTKEKREAHRSKAVIFTESKKTSSPSSAQKISNESKKLPKIF